MAVMMMVAMRPRVHSFKIEKIAFGVNCGFFVVGQIPVIRHTRTQPAGGVIPRVQETS
jgi:hypothetical protein